MFDAAPDFFDPSGTNSKTLQFLENIENKLDSSQLFCAFLIYKSSGIVGFGGV